MGFSPIPDAGPFLAHVGPVLADGDVVGLRIEARHLNRSGMAQGGLLATVVDFALGRAIRASAEDGKRGATVSLTTDFLGAAREGDFVEARTEVEVGKLDGHQKRIPATVVPIPFYDPKKERPRS